MNIEKRHIKLSEYRVRELNISKKFVPKNELDTTGGMETKIPRSDFQMAYTVVYTMKCVSCDFIFEETNACNPCPNCGFKPNCRELNILKRTKKAE